MGFRFSEADIERIAHVLGVPYSREGALVRLAWRDDESGRRLAIEVMVELGLPPHLADRPTNLVTVYATNAFLQLHGCTGFIASEELGEVIFFAKQGGATNGMVIERGAGCSLYSNVDDRLLSADFTQLPSEVMMGSVVLSMTGDEGWLDDLKEE